MTYPEFSKRFPKIGPDVGYMKPGFLYDSRVFEATIVPQANIPFFSVPHGGAGGQAAGGTKSWMDTNLENAGSLPKGMFFLASGVAWQYRSRTHVAPPGETLFFNLAIEAEIQVLHAYGYDVRLFVGSGTNYIFNCLLEQLPSLMNFANAVANAILGVPAGWGGNRLADILKFPKAAPYPIGEQDILKMTMESDLPLVALSATIDYFLQLILVGKWFLPYS